MRCAARRARAARGRARAARVGGCTDASSRAFRSDAQFGDGSCVGGRRLAERRARLPPPPPPPRSAKHWELARLTALACNSSDPSGSLRARMRAALLWGSLTDQESETSCHDCARNVSNTSCRAFFESNAGLDGHKQAERARRRRRALTQEEGRRKLETAVRAHLEKACCARSKSRPWEPERCAAKYCVLHMQRSGAARMAHTLRRLRERGHPGARELEPQHLVGVDLLAPLTHAVPECREARTRCGRNAMLGPSDEECMARSIAHHVATKNGVDPATVTDAVGKFGFTMADLLKRAHDFVGLAKGVHGDKERAPEAPGGRARAKRAAARRKLRERPADAAGATVRASVGATGAVGAAGDAALPPEGARLFSPWKPRARAGPDARCTAPRRRSRRRTTGARAPRASCAGCTERRAGSTRDEGDS